MKLSLCLKIVRGTEIVILHWHKSGFFTAPGLWVEKTGVKSSPHFRPVNEKSQTRSETSNGTRQALTWLRRNVCWGSAWACVLQVILASCLRHPCLYSLRLLFPRCHDVLLILWLLNPTHPPPLVARYFNDLFTSNYSHMSKEGTVLIKGNQPSGCVCTFDHV